jgi:hypothetical protein
MPGEPQIVTREVVDMVEEYVYKELSDAEKYDNRTPLDESGIWSLHRLVAKAYMIGWRDGEFLESERSRRSSWREREAIRKDCEEQVKAAKADAAAAEVKAAKASAKAPTDGE